MGSCLPLPLFDDRALMATAIRLGARSGGDKARRWCTVRGLSTCGRSPYLWTIVVAALPRWNLLPMWYRFRVGGHPLPSLFHLSPYGTNCPLDAYSLEQGQLPSERCFLDVASHVSRGGWGGAFLRPGNQLSRPVVAEEKAQAPFYHELCRRRTLPSTPADC